MKACEPLCPAWATNAPPSNQSRFEVEYPGGTSQSSPLFLCLTAGYPRNAASRTPADRKDPKASAARKVSPNFECRVKRGPMCRTLSRATLNRWAKICAAISGVYRSIVADNSRHPNYKTAGETPAASKGGGAQLLRGFARNRSRRARGVDFRERLEHFGERRAIDVTARALDDVELAVGPHHLALADGVARDALHRHAFEDVEVDVLVMRLGRDSARACRVPHHEVGVGADADRAFARIDVEDLRSVGGGDLHELARRHAAGADAVMPQHRHAVLDAAGAVRDLGEVVAASRLLIGAEAAVIGGGGLQIAGLQRAPQIFLVLLGPERRAHHVRRRIVPVGMAIDRVIDQQMAGEHLAIDALAFEPRADDRLDRLLAGVVHDVERRTQHLRDTDGAVGRLAFHFRRPRQRVPLGAGDAALQ